MRWGFIPVLLPMLLHSLPALAQGYAGPYNQQIEFTYAEPRDPVFRDIYERLKRREVLHELAQFLAPLRLPRKLVVSHVWMAPAWQELNWRAAQRSLAVMCPACRRSPEGLLALMGSANRVLITRAGSMSQ